MADPRLSSKVFLIVKPEVVAGTDSIPTSANGIYAENLTVKKLNAKTIERNTSKPFMGANLKIVSAFDAMVDVDIAMAIGGNANGVPEPGVTPAYDALLRGCGLAKTAVGSAVSGTAQGGTLNTITLAAGASSSDDAYAGLSIAVSQAVGAAQAPGVPDKNIVKLAATDYERSATLQASAGTTSVTLDTNASAEDNYYVGMTLTVSGQSRVITAYVGATKVATLASTLSPAVTTAAAYTIDRVADYYADWLATIGHFSGTVVSAGASLSTDKVVYLPLAIVGANNVQGCELKVTTGSVVDTRYISSYDVNTRMATLASKLSTPALNSSTFAVQQTVPIITSDGASKTITLKWNLKFASIATAPYTISARRLIIGYNGTTKVATTSSPFKKRPTDASTYIMGKYVKYTPVTSGHISNTFYYYEDGALHSFTYGRGTGVFEFTSGSLPLAKFSYMGLVQRYEDASFPAFDLSTWVDPLPVNYENTRDLIVHGYSNTVMDKISLDIGNQLVHLNAPGADMIYIKDRDVKGSLTIWAPLPSEIDFYNAIKNAAAAPLSFTHGPIGNQISLFCKNVQLLNPSDSEKDGIKMLGLDLNIMPTGTGDNDFALILQ